MAAVQLVPTETHPDHIEGAAERLARREWALIYQLGHILAAVARGAFWKLAYGHLDAYLQQVLGISSSTSRRWVELAAGVDRYPALRESFAAGRLCPSKIELLLPVLKRNPEEQLARIKQAERLSVRALRRAVQADLQHEPDLVYVSFELDGNQVLSWRQARETARADLEAMVPRGEILEYVVADYLSGQERLAYEEVLMPSRPEREYPLAPPILQPVHLEQPHIPTDPYQLQQAALTLLEERKRLALRQGELLLELVTRYSRRAPVGQLAERKLGLSRSTAYKRISLAVGCRRYPGLEQLSTEQACQLLPLLEAHVAAKAWMDFARQVTLLELQKWVRHLRWQMTFCFREFSQWAWRAPNPGERPPERNKAGLLPTLAHRPLDTALSLATRTAVQVLEIRHPQADLARALHPVQVLENGPTRRIGWMIPRDFYPLLMEGIDLAAEGLFHHPGQALDEMFKQFVQAYRKKGKGSRAKVRQRDGYCCQAPGCTARGKLHVHHITFRSQGGSEELWNKVLVCSACHCLIHERTLRVFGRAPYDLVWVRPYERWEKGRKVPPRPPDLVSAA